MKFLFCLFLATSVVWAAENTVTTKVELPKWKSTFNSYYYNFEGTRASNRANYKFGDTTLNMQLMTLQYQLDNGWTLMALAQHLQNNVRTQFEGVWYKDNSAGFGDTLISAIKPTMLGDSVLLVTDVGVSVPTGSIDKKNPLNPTLNYPYNMQMGSGTYDPSLGATLLWMQPKFQVGNRVSTLLRSGAKNENGYRLGNLYRLDSWVDVPTKSGLIPRLVGYYRYRDAIRGADDTYGRNPYVEFYHHSQINWDVSAALKYAYAFTPKVSLNAEAGVPLAQDSQNYDNVVVSTEYYLNLGVTGSF